MTLYNDKFYENRHKNTLYSAETILSIVQDSIPEIKSAVDLGCGVGTWLSVLEKRGATKICGLDGSWVNKDYLEIQKDSFIEHNFSKGIDPIIDRTFDLAISLEVAEHLPPSSAEGFISLLTSLSEVVLFSAAIPQQGGTGHINEQWANYWISLFENRGYVVADIIRKRIWNDESIPRWYRQNTLVFIKKERIQALKVKSSYSDYIPPEVYLLYFNRLATPGIKQSLRALFLAFRRRILRMFRTDS
jgi:SAM-dependent methyltransferase